jgi:hypothetical protein
MAKRNDIPPEEHSSDTGADGSGSGNDGLRRIEAPRLVPAQDESRGPRIGDVVTVPYEEAAHEGGYSDDGKPSAATYERRRRFIPLAAAIAVAAAIGAVTGALTTAGLSHFSEQPSAATALRDDGRHIEDAVGRIGRDLAALKSNVDASAKSAASQMARLNERLEKTDKVQSEAAAKVAKLAGAMERAPAAADPVTTGSIATPVPAVPPLPTLAPAPAMPSVVDGWTLRSVQNGTALIQGRIGLVEVEPGDSLPGLGRIENIRRQDGRWVVVTSRGLIVPR